MSYGTQMQGSMAEPQQPGLKSLVQQLNCSYVALWSFNPQTRNLEWQGGHWRHSGDTQGWNEQYFNSTYKPCKFRTRFGSVGMAFADGKSIWRNGSKVVDNAGSKQQAEFLQSVRISTAIFIPWSDGVLELGTCENWPENLGVMESIRNYFMNNIVPTLGQQGSGHSQLSTTSMQQAAVVAPSSFPSRSLMQQPSSYSSLSPLRHVSDNLNPQSFEPNSLNQQIIRREASMNPDMFLQEDVEGKEIGNGVVLDGGMLLDAARPWKLPMSSMQQQTPMSSAAAANQVYYPPVQQRTRGQYRSRSGTTSSSVSSLEEAASTRLSAGDSPEQNMLFMANSSQRQASHSNTSSSPRRGTSSRSPEMNPLVDTMATPSLQEPRTGEDEIQLDDLSLMLADAGEPLETGNMSPYSFPSLETPGNMSHVNLVDSGAANGHCNNIMNDNNNDSYNGTQPGQTTVWCGVHAQKPFKIWRHARISAPVLRKKNDRQNNQVLLRRSIDIMKQISHSFPNNNHVPAAAGASNDQQAVMHNVGQHGPRIASSSSPETVTDGISHDPFEQVPPRVQRRPRGGSRIASMGPVHSGHDEAARNHMLAERCRRVKQKENFAALRRLVPIISKADKASILGDAIVYLKDLQNQIDGLEASQAESERRYETLQKSYQELEQRNKELESMVQPTRLRST